MIMPSAQIHDGLTKVSELLMAHGDKIFAASAGVALLLLLLAGWQAACRSVGDVDVCFGGEGLLGVVGMTMPCKTAPRQRLRNI